MNNTWYQIKAQSGSDEVEVLIYDEIGWWGVSAKSFVSELKASGAKKIHVRINSPGGDVFQGLAIYNFLRGQSDVTVSIDGLAASAASIVAMAGKTIRMAENAFLMIHNPWGFAMGESEDMRQVAEVLDKIREQLVATYQRKTGKEAAQITQWMNDETWFNFDEAKSHGFIDAPTPDSESRVTNHESRIFNLSRFGKVPAALNQSTENTMQTQTKTDDKGGTQQQTQTSAPPDLAAQRAAFNAELTRYRTAFGDANGAKWFSEGKSFEEALGLENTELKAQLKARDEKITGLETKIGAMKRGLPEGATFQEDEEGKTKTLTAQYNEHKKTNPAEATRFFRKNKAALIAENNGAGK